MTPISRRLEETRKALTRAMRLNQNDDIVQRDFIALGQDCLLLYVEGMSSGSTMSQFVLKPLMECRELGSGVRASQTVMQKLLQVTEAEVMRTIEEVVEAVFEGQCAVLMDTVGEAFILDTRGFVKRSISTPLTENVVVGPHEAFTESLRDNLTLMHRMVHSPLLLCKSLSVGTEIPTQTAMLFMDGIARQEDVEEVEKRLTESRAPYVLSGGMLEQLMEDDPFAPLPQTVSTERPDRAVSFLMEGQVLVLMDGSPQVMALPISLWHLMHAPDDTAMRFQYGTFMRLLRVFGAVCALLLPAVFLSLVMYHPASIPMSLLTSIMESRVSVPISLFGEAVLMLTLFGLINEAGARVPGLMGSSMGLVSALILGSAAVDAGLVSPLLIIVVALSGLGSYAIPDYSLSLAFRILQMLLLIAGGLCGLYGVTALFLLLLCWTAGMQSLGRPYLAPLSPKRAHNPDLIYRAPIYRQRLRTYLANPFAMLRLRGRMRPNTDGEKRP